MLTTDAVPPPADDTWLGCNPFDPAFRDDPYPSLARLRALDPVNEMPVGIWRLTRYADVNRLLHDVPAGVRTTDGVLPGVDESLTGKDRSEEHTSELQSRFDLVCRLLLEKKKK